MSRTNRVIVSILLIVIWIQPKGLLTANSSIPFSNVNPNKQANSTGNIPLQGQALENMVAYARLLGYIQFFHPSDEAGRVNWESFAIAGVSTIENAQTSEELANNLEKLFRPYAPTIRVFPTGNKCHPLQISQSKPEVQKLYTVRWRHHGYGFLDNQEDWLNDYFYSERIYEPTLSSEVATGDFSIDMPLLKDLGGGVSACVPIVLYATRDGTLPKSTPLNTSNYTFEGVPVTPTGEDRATRLADIILAWNIFQHFYQYFDAVKVDWDRALEMALAEAAIDADACEFKDTLQMMIAQLEDGHGFIDMKNGLCTYNKLIPWITWDWIENRLVITDAQPLRGEKEGIERGDVVLAIDGVSTVVAISEMERYVSGATEARRRFLALQELLQGEAESLIQLKIQKPNGRLISVQEMRLYKEDEFGYPAEKELKPGVFYLNLDKLTQDEFMALLPQLSQAKGIIFDLRGYPGDILITALGYLSKTQLTSPEWGFPIIQYPDHENMTFEFETWTLEPSVPYLGAKKVFIADERAISLAETWLSMVSAYHLAEIVGEPSAGENCNAIFEWLPADYRITWTGCKVLNQDGSQFHGIGIQPTISTLRTIQGVIGGRDELLEKALEILR